MIGQQRSREECRVLGAVDLGNAEFLVLFPSAPGQVQHGEGCGRIGLLLAKGENGVLCLSRCVLSFWTCEPSLVWPVEHSGPWWNGRPSGVFAV